MGWRADARRASSAEDRRAHVLCPSLLATSDDHRRCSSCPLSSFFCRWSVKSLLTQLFTARKLVISTGQEPLVSTGSLPGTIRSVLNASAFSTGRSDRYQMTQSSTGHQHRPVLKIFLSKKIKLLLRFLILSLSSFFFFPPSCSIFLLCFSRTDFCSSQTEKKRWEEKKSAREEKNK